MFSLLTCLFRVVLPSRPPSPVSRSTLSLLIPTFAQRLQVSQILAGRERSAGSCEAQLPSSVSGLQHQPLTSQPSSNQPLATGRSAPSISDRPFQSSQSDGRRQSGTPVLARVHRRASTSAPGARLRPVSSSQDGGGYRGIRRYGGELQGPGMGPRAVPAPGGPAGR